MDNEPILIRIDDYLLNVTILGDNPDGTVAVEYTAIHKDPSHKIDYDDINEKLNTLVNDVLKTHIETLND